MPYPGVPMRRPGRLARGSAADGDFGQPLHRGENVVTAGGTVCVISSKCVPYIRIAGRCLGVARGRSAAPLRHERDVVQRAQHEEQARLDPAQAHLPEDFPCR